MRDLRVMTRDPGVVTRSLGVTLVLASFLSAIVWLGLLQPFSGVWIADEISRTGVVKFLGGGEEQATPGERRVAPDGSSTVVFEPNHGQTKAGTEFLSRGKSYTLHLRPAEAVFVLRPGSSAISPVLPDGRSDGRPVEGTTRELTMRLDGANLEAEITGVEPLAGRSNYILGNSPSAWISGVQHFARVRYQNIYPGIDLVFYGTGGRVEYDFVLAARRDPAVIRISLDGQETVSLDEGGNLILQVGGREISHSAPLAYQVENLPLNGSEAFGGGFLALGGQETRAVEARFVLYEDPESGSSLGFEVGTYDSDRPLVIDPAVGFSTFLGGSDAEEMPHVVADGRADVYVAGTTSSIDYPHVLAEPDAGPAEAAAPTSGSNAFVTKLSADGSTILYSTYFGGSGTDRANGIAVDDQGNVYLTGQTDSIDFPTRNPLQGGLNGSTDAFAAKVSADGAGLIYSTYFGGSGTEAGMGLAIDTQGGAYITGQTSSSDLPTLSAVQGSLGGASDGFVSKLSPQGDALVYSTYLGGASANDGGLSVAVDADGSAYVTGITESDDFPLVNALQTEFGGGGTDAFASKIDKAGASLTYSTYLGGSGAEVGMSIDVDDAGHAYLAGQTSSADFPIHGAFQTVLVAGPDAFLAKLAPTGGGLVYSTYLGGSGADVAAGVAVDQSGNVHLAGMTSSADFPLADALQPEIGGGADAFILRLDDLGRELSYSTFLGGAGNDAGVSIALDGAGNALVTGQTGSPDFPLLNATQGTHGGVQDAFVARFCLALIFERNERFHSAGGRGEITVTAPEGCVWPAVSESEWISVSSGSTGVGSDMVVVEVAANGTGAPRAGLVRVAGKTVILEQAEARECTYRLSDNSESFHGQGGVSRVRVFTSDDCAWTAASTVPWISINSGDTGVGEGTVSFTVRANRTGRQRAGTLIIAGETFTVFDWLRDQDY